MNMQVLDNFGIVVEKCSHSIRGLFSKVIEIINEEKVESVPASDDKEVSLEKRNTKLSSSSLTSDPIKETVTGLEAGAESSHVKEESNGSETDKCKAGSFNDTNKKEQKMTRKNSKIKPKRTDEETKSWLKKLENLDKNKQ
ncbi:hypothetical protein QYM36_014026 [Artemia franciscana]|uniref:Uncharacterized protein n=1 Tax=Artemia franciscana TaxID=6661 RepID=A0AA88KXQ5_ARTSF|nr:hypothetical protein QYM36_014026 [Artemia franciscana]